MSKRWPWAKVSPSDFFSRCAPLSAAERGVLVSMEMKMLEEGSSIASDQRSLARLCGTDARTLAKVLPMLLGAGLIEEIGGRLISPTIAPQIKEREKLSEQRSRSASDGWEKRKGNNDPPMQTHTEVRGRDREGVSDPPTASALRSTEDGIELKRDPAEGPGQDIEGSLSGGQIELPGVGRCWVEATGRAGQVWARSMTNGRDYEATFQDGLWIGVAECDPEDMPSADHSLSQASHGAR